MGKVVKSLSFLILAFFLTSCDNSSDECDESYLSVVENNVFTESNGYALRETLDALTHEYDITIFLTGEICSVGYQNPSNYKGGYTIEIINQNTQQTYRGVHTFSQKSYTYQSIDAITVNAGDHIKVKRVILPGYNSIVQAIGQVYTKKNAYLGKGDTIQYPITINPHIEINSANFYDNTPRELTSNWAVPKIGLGFKNQ